MIDRRKFVGGITFGLLAAPLAAEGQQAGKVYRIGYISANFPDGSDPVWDAFAEKLRELGYVPGQNVVIERRVGEAAFRPLRLLRLNWFVSRST